MLSSSVAVGLLSLKAEVPGRPSRSCLLHLTLPSPITGRLSQVPDPVTPRVSDLIPSHWEVWRDVCWVLEFEQNQFGCCRITRSRNKSSLVTFHPRLQPSAGEAELQSWICVTTLSCWPFYLCALANLPLHCWRHQKKSVMRWCREGTIGRARNCKHGLSFGFFSGLGCVMGLSGLKLHGVLPLGMWKSGDSCWVPLPSSS